MSVRIFSFLLKKGCIVLEHCACAIVSLKTNNKDVKGSFIPLKFKGHLFSSVK